MKSIKYNFLNNTKTRIFIFVFLVGIHFSNASNGIETVTPIVGQNSGFACNELVTLADGVEFDNITTSTPNYPLSLIPPCFGFISGLDNVIGDPNASANLMMNGLGCTAAVSVKDNDDFFLAGTYAGFEVSAISVLEVTFLSNIVVETRLNGVLQESKQVLSQFLGANSVILSGSGRKNLGFVTTKDFDEISIRYFSLVSVLNTAQVYRALVQEFCVGQALECNTPTKMTNPSQPVIVNNQNTGINGVACVGCAINDSNNVLTSDPDDYASINLFAAVGVGASFAVENVIEEYPIGTYAGFDISNPNLITLDVVSWVTVSTLLNGVVQESSTDLGLASLDVSLIAGDSRQTLGFVSTKPFDQVKIDIVNLASVFNVTRIYGAVFQKFCSAEVLSCNTPVRMTNPEFPVSINAQRTGINALACIGCNISNTQNILDADEDNYASIVLGTSIISDASIAIKSEIDDYGPNTYIGFDMQFATLLNFEVLQNITLCTFLDGELQECKNGQLDLADVGLPFISNTGRNTLGFISTLPFDEVKLTMQNVANINFGETRVYGVLVQQFCEKYLECSDSYLLSSPEFPVVVSSANTGVSGLACIGCSVINSDNVITADPTDAATISMPVGVLSDGSISVASGIGEFPAGTFAGYVVSGPNTILGLDIFPAITVSTYLNGQPQESRFGLGLLDFSALFSWFGVPGNYQNIGFQTTLPYDEIQISVRSLASVINVINVHSAFISTLGSDGLPLEGGAQLNCGPILQDDTFELNEDEPKILDIFANDLGVQATETIAFTQPAHGTVSILDIAGTPDDLSDDQVTYIPNLDYFGSDTFDYTLTDAAALTYTAKVTLSVLSVNDLPIANDDVVVVVSETSNNPIYFFVDNSNGADTFGGDGPNAITPLTFPTTSVNGGAVVLNNNATPLDPSDDYILFTPATGFYGDDTIEYTITDENGDQDSATVFVEVFLDTDGDGVPNLLDLDDDNDGIVDTLEGSDSELDTDGDTVPDYLDLDSDNDGIADNFEAQSSSSYVAPSGAGLNMTDANNNGLDDVYELAQGGIDITPVDTDSDNIPDYLDLDSDNDTYFDIEEGINAALDTDNDGKTNGVVGENGLDNSLESTDDFLDVNGSINTGSIAELVALFLDIDEDLMTAIATTPMVHDINFRDQSIPDYLPVIVIDNTISNNNLMGSANLTIYVTENAKNKNKKNEPIKVTFEKHSSYTFVFDNTLSTFNPDVVLNNSDWAYSSTTTTHILTYIGGNGTFNADSVSYIGITLNFASVPTVTNNFPFTVSIAPNSGGEINNSNNDDTDYITFFQ